MSEDIKKDKEQEEIVEESTTESSKPKKKKVVAKKKTTKDTEDKYVVGERGKDDEIERKVKLILDTTPYEKLGEYIVKFREQYEKEELNDALSDQDSPESHIVTMSRQYEDCKELSVDMLKSSFQSGKLSEVYDDGEIVLKDSRNPKVIIPPNVKELSGKDAEYLVLARGGNVMRLILLNSGLTLRLKCPTPAQLDRYRMEINEGIDKYGRMFGSYFYTYADYYIRMAIINLLPELILDCNLKNWKQKNTLLKAISIHDYNIILWAIGSLIFKVGMDYTFQCTNEECLHTLDSKLDLSKLRLNNFSVMTEDHIKFIYSSESRSLRSVLKYQDSLFEPMYLTIGEDTIEVKVPSLYEYKEAGLNYLAEMNSEELNDDDSKAYYILANAYLVFLPWISKLIYGDKEENGAFTRDKSAIRVALDMAAVQDSGIGSEIKEFITKTALSHICLPVDKCPKCKTAPEALVNGYLPLEMQYTFFILSLMSTTPKAT